MQVLMTLDDYHVKFKEKGISLTKGQQSGPGISCFIF
jgi:hypothetical protein